ncbi:hypothetical protein BJ912DRAFT_1065545 [Pholiota molesta]|nr:hypothetical protein BJ912DRAFT_1065545 [Pholiota molesta]
MFLAFLCVLVPTLFRVWHAFRTDSSPLFIDHALVKLPTQRLGPQSSLQQIAHAYHSRHFLGTCVGGNYPTSASVVSDRAKVRKGGTMLAYIFSSQGWGSFVGSLVTIIVLLCYAIVWRTIARLSLVPNVGTFYQRLTLSRFTSYMKVQDTEASQVAVVGDEIAKSKATRHDKALNAKTNVAGVGHDIKVARTST